MPPKMVAADFDFGTPIGTGAFSKVVVGVYRPTNTRYAVKFISKRSILDAPTEEERTRMAEVARRETRMLLMCEHSNIVKFYAAMQSPEDLLYVTELCEGGELLKHIERRGRLPLEAARHAIAELFSAIFYLHHGEKRTPLPTGGSAMKPTTVIHRDIKPENVMLTADKHLRLIDFGTAVICESAHDKPAGEESGAGRAQTFCGTTYYMSPELLQDNYTCCQSDYWGCGCVLYLMLVGSRPFDAPTQYLLIKAILEKEPEFPPELDSDARDLIQKLLVKNPASRLGMTDILQHPFFATINFANLAQQNVEQFWYRETPWVDETTVSACAGCGKGTGSGSPKPYCCYCGNIHCKACLQQHRVIPGSRHSTAECVCKGCADCLDRCD